MWVLVVRKATGNIMFFESGNVLVMNIVKVFSMSQLMGLIDRLGLQSAFHYTSTKENLTFIKLISDRKYSVLQTGQKYKWCYPTWKNVRWLHMHVYMYNWVSPKWSKMVNLKVFCSSWLCFLNILPADWLVQYIPVGKIHK